MAPSAPTPLLKKGGAASGRAEPVPRRLLGCEAVGIAEVEAGFAWRLGVFQVAEEGRC